MVPGWGFCLKQRFSELFWLGPKLKTKIGLHSNTYHPQQHQKHLGKAKACHGAKILNEGQTNLI